MMVLQIRRTTLQKLTAPLLAAAPTEEKKPEYVSYNDDVFFAATTHGRVDWLSNVAKEEKLGEWGSWEGKSRITLKLGSRKEREKTETRELGLEEWEIVSSNIYQLVANEMWTRNILG